MENTCLRCSSNVLVHKTFSCWASNARRDVGCSILWPRVFYMEAAGLSPDFIFRRSWDGNGKHLRHQLQKNKENVPISPFLRFCIRPASKYNCLNRENEKARFPRNKILSWQVWYYGNEANNFLHSFCVKTAQL